MPSILRLFPNVKSAKHQTMLASGCIALFVIPALLFKATLSKNSQSPAWTDARGGVPASLVKKALSFDSTLLVDTKLIKVLQIPSVGAGKLYLFDFRSPQLCGVAGCVYLVYHESGQLLLRLIANPYVPPEEELIRVVNTVRSGFPCFVFTQPTAIEDTVSRTTYCYQGEEFVRFNEAFTAVGKDFRWRQGKR